MKSLKEVLEVAKNHVGENNYHELHSEFDFIFEITPGVILKPYEVLITRSDLLFFCDKGTITMVIDYYNNEPVASIFDWELDE